MTFDADDKITEGKFIQESERDASNPGNDEEKVVQLEGDGKFGEFFIPEVDIYTRSLTTGASINSGGSPVPVLIDQQGNISIANASDPNSAKFIGFVGSNTSVQAPTYLNSGSDGSSTFSATANAGNDRALIVCVNSNPSSVDWGGTSMTKVDYVTSSGAENQSLWYAPIGDSNSNQTKDLSFGSDTPGFIIFSVYQDVNQSDAGGSTDANTGDNQSSTSSPWGDITQKAETTDGIWVRGVFHSWGSAASGNDGQTRRVRYNPNNENAEIHDVANTTMKSITRNMNPFGGGPYKPAYTTIGIGLLPANSTPVDFQFGYIVNGLSGLTAGERYYLQDTDGNIGKTPGSNTVFVGKAVSSTELLIAHSG